MNKQKKWLIFMAIVWTIYGLFGILVKWDFRVVAFFFLAWIWIVTMSMQSKESESK